MKCRDNMSAVIEGLQREHGLLAAFLEATDRIDWRALQKRVVIGELPTPINVEAHQASTAAPLLPEVVPSTTSTFVFRRANLMRVPWKTQTGMRRSFRELTFRGALSLICCAITALCVGGLLSALAENLRSKAPNHGVPNNQLHP
jgi:hypothetical protein